MDSVSQKNDNSEASQLLSLIKPLKALADNWDIDLATELGGFIRLTQNAPTQFEDKENDENNSNKWTFAQAALIIQNSASIYSKKVQHLFNLTNEAHTFIFKHRGSFSNFAEDVDEDDFDDVDTKSKHKSSRIKASQLDRLDFWVKDRSERFLNLDFLSADYLDEIAAKDSTSRPKKISRPNRMAFVNRNNRLADFDKEKTCDYDLGRDICDIDADDKSQAVSVGKGISMNDQNIIVPEEFMVETGYLSQGQDATSLKEQNLKNWAENFEERLGNWLENHRGIIQDALMGFVTPSSLEWKSTELLDKNGESIGYKNEFEINNAIFLADSGAMVYQHIGNLATELQKSHEKYMEKNCELKGTTELKVQDGQPMQLLEGDNVDFQPMLADDTMDEDFADPGGPVDIPQYFEVDAGATHDTKEIASSQEQKFKLIPKKASKSLMSKEEKEQSAVLQFWNILDPHSSTGETTTPGGPRAYSTIIQDKPFKKAKMSKAFKYVERLAKKRDMEDSEKLKDPIELLKFGSREFLFRSHVADNPSSILRFRGSSKRSAIGKFIYECIKKAKEINSGKQTDPNQPAIERTDSDIFWQKMSELDSDFRRDLILNSNIKEDEEYEMVPEEEPSKQVHNEEEFYDFGMGGFNNEDISNEFPSNGNQDNDKLPPLDMADGDEDSDEDIPNISGAFNHSYDDATGPIKSFEQLCQMKIRSYMENADAYQKKVETTVTRNVKAWEEKLFPLLEKQTKRGCYDIDVYNEKVIDAFTEENKFEPFSRVADYIEPFDVCRYFLSVLHLANIHRVEISKSDDQTVLVKKL